jgi:hypothetical protein
MKERTEGKETWEVVTAKESMFDIFVMADCFVYQSRRYNTE